MQPRQQTPRTRGAAYGIEKRFHAPYAGFGAYSRRPGSVARRIRVVASTLRTRRGGQRTVLKPWSAASNVAAGPYPNRARHTPESMQGMLLDARGFGEYVPS